MRARLFSIALFRVAYNSFAAHFIYFDYFRKDVVIFRQRANIHLSQRRRARSHLHARQGQRLQQHTGERRRRQHLFNRFCDLDSTDSESARCLL